MKTTSDKIASAVVLILGLFLVILGGFKSDPKDTDPTPTGIKGALQETAVVTRIVDGDTIELSTGHVVRYIGIDTPETGGPVGLECFGKEAKAFNKLLLEGKTVRLVQDVSDTDRYGRLLMYVYLGDLFVNEYLVAEGYAVASAYPPDIAFQDRLEAAEASARAASKGLWESCKN